MEALGTADFLDGKRTEPAKHEARPAKGRNVGLDRCSESNGCSPPEVRSRYLSYTTIELALLAASVVLGIVHIIIVSNLQSWQRGYRWTASSREQSVARFTGIAGRAERAFRN